MLQATRNRAAEALGLRPAIAGLPSSKIRKIAHAGMGRADRIELWFREPDTPTPNSSAMPPRVRSPRATLLSAQCRHPRAAPHACRVHERPLRHPARAGERDRVRLGDEHLMLAMQALVDPGDVVVTTTPARRTGVDHRAHSTRSELRVADRVQHRRASRLRAARRDCRGARRRAVRRRDRRPLPRLSLPRPEAAFYAFIRVDGMQDSVAFAKDLLTRTEVGLAPGAAFGDGDHNFDAWLRLCFAATLPTLERAFDRLADYLASV